LPTNYACSRLAGVATDPRGRIELTDAEWKVMNAVWDPGAATARQVCDALAGTTGWAYTTVRTLLERLAEKGALARRREGLADVYEPLLPRAQARKTALRALVSRAFGGGFAPLLHHLVGEEPLSSRDRAELRRLLRDSEPRKRAP
jgi:BlaI family penicillinase repressor